MSEDNVTTPGTESHQLQAPGHGFDCTGIIEQGIEHTSAKHANTMDIIANAMENQQQQMNKITDILAGILQFLVQGNLDQNTPNNRVPPSIIQQQTLGKTTLERFPPIDRNDNDQDQPTDQMGHNAPFAALPNTSQKSIIVTGQTTQIRVPPATCTTDIEGKSDKTLSLVASNLCFQANETEIQKVVYSHSAKEDDTHSSASGSTHDEDQKYWLQPTKEYDDVMEVGPEISSSMASATKIF